MLTSSRLFTGILLLTASSPLFAQPGQSGMAFLKLGISGRSIGMADAASAVVSGAAATYYNPAGLISISDSTSQLMFMHREWIQDTKIDFLGSSIVLDNRDALGAALNSTAVSGIELRTKPGPADGTFTSREFSFGLSYARLVSSDLRAGITAKFLYERILFNESTGFAADIGGLWTTPVEHLSVGAALCNIGSMGALSSEKTVLPSLLRLGPAYALTFGTGGLGALLAADLVHIFPEKRSYLDAGTELTLTSSFIARGGYQFGSDGRGLTLGVGIQYGAFALDYAYAKISYGLGDAHTLSLAMNF